MMHKLLFPIQGGGLYFSPFNCVIGVSVRTMSKGDEESTIWFIHVFPMLVLIFQSDRRPVGRMA